MLDMQGAGKPKFPFRLTKEGALQLFATASFPPRMAAEIVKTIRLTVYALTGPEANRGFRRYREKMLQHDILRTDAHLQLQTMEFMLNAVATRLNMDYVLFKPISARIVKGDADGVQGFDS